MSENKLDSEIDDRAAQETKKQADVEASCADAKEEEETNGDAAPPVKKAKGEPARPRSQRESKAAAGKRVSSLEAAAKEGEALLKELGHKDSSDPDSGRRRTRSQTRGTPTTPPVRQQRQAKAEPARRTPAKQPARSSTKKSPASKRSKKDEEEELSGEESSTAATTEEEPASSKDAVKESKEHKKEEVSNEESPSKARQADDSEANADTSSEKKEEPEVNNKEDIESKADDVEMTDDTKVETDTAPTTKEKTTTSVGDNAPAAALPVAGSKPPEEVAA